MRRTYAQVHSNLIPRLKSLTRNASDSFPIRAGLRKRPKPTFCIEIFGTSSGAGAAGVRCVLSIFFFASRTSSGLGQSRVITALCVSARHTTFTDPEFLSQKSRGFCETKIQKSFSSVRRTEKRRVRERETRGVCARGHTAMRRFRARDFRAFGSVTHKEIPLEEEIFLYYILFTCRDRGCVFALGVLVSVQSGGYR